MEKQQAAAIAEAVLDAHLQAQQYRSAALTAASRQRARNRDIAWFGLAVIVYVAGKMIWEGFHEVQPHILGLVFATTLIGIAIDYSFHGMLAANQGQAAFRRMLPSLLLGLLTTVLGYLALVLLPLPVLNQVAVFICAGLLAAFITVYIVFPRWLPAHSMQVAPAFLRCCAAISRGYTRVPAKVVLQVGLPALLAIGGSLFYLMQFNDDVRLFNQSPQTLIAQELQVRSVGGQNWDSRFIVVLGDSYQQLLQREQQLQPQLQRWQQQAKLSTWQSTVQSVPPLQQQAELQQLLQQAYQSDTVQQYLQQLQLSPPPTTQQWLTPEQLPAAMLQQIQPLQNAQAQFVEKHRALMNERNLHNQAFYRRTMQNLPMSLGELLSSCRYGLVESKVRYYLKHRLAWAIRLRKQILNKGIKGLFGHK